MCNSFKNHNLVVFIFSVDCQGKEIYCVEASPQCTIFKMNDACTFAGRRFCVHKRHFQQYFSYIVVVSFIGGGSWRTRRKPPICRYIPFILYATIPFFTFIYLVFQGIKFQWVCFLYIKVVLCCLKALLHHPLYTLLLLKTI